MEQQQQQELASSRCPEQQHQAQLQSKPRLEIPDPTKLQSVNNSASPRSMHGFPDSPQGSTENTSSASTTPAARSDGVKSFDDWCSSSSPALLPLNSSSSLPPNLGEKKGVHLYAGEFVLVRCNQSKWLLGQVRRSSKTGFIIWVEAAQTLVNVPYELVASHLVKLDEPCSQPSPRSSLTETHLERTRSGELMAPYQCVRPAHLSHRKLYQPLRTVPERSVSLPGNLEILKTNDTSIGDSKQEEEMFISSIDRERVGRSSYSVCSFRFPEGDEDCSFMTRFGRSLASSQSCGGGASAWITVIENGLDIRKKPQGKS